MGLSRMAFYEMLGMRFDIVAPLLDSAYKLEARREWMTGSGDSPHGAAWHTSMHASSASGTDPYACGRAALYTLMDLPDPAPREPKLTTIFNVGSDLEHNWVRRFKSAGMLLSKSPALGDKTQTLFIDAEHWLTGAADAIILPPFWTKSHNVEIKTTSHEKVQKMLDDPSQTPYSQDKYVRQLKTYIGLAHEQNYSPTVTVCEESWAIMEAVYGPIMRCPVHDSLDCAHKEITLDPPDNGTLIYSSREEPLTTVEYHIDYDAEHMRATREKLAQWQQDFLDGRIPPHPREKERAKWSVHPCQYCSYKGTVCKSDYADKIDTLVDSHAIEFARGIRPDYDYEVARAQVLERWKVQDPLKSAEELVA